MKLPAVLLALTLPAMAAEPNTLDAAEKSAGFKLIFDGKSLDGWRGYKKDAAPAGWEVKDDAITLVKGGAGDLISKEQYANFELRFQFKIAPDGNSGVMWRVAETDGPPYLTGPEYQILDSHAKTGYPDERKKGNIAGAFYDLIPAKPELSKPAGEWNDGGIRLEGTKITLTLNGTVTAEIDMASDRWKELLAKSKFAKWERFAKEPKGHLCFQDHGNQVSFRTIRVLPLP